MISQIYECNQFIQDLTEFLKKQHLLSFPKESNPINILIKNIVKTSLKEIKISNYFTISL